MEVNHDEIKRERERRGRFMVGTEEGLKVRRKRKLSSRCMKCERIAATLRSSGRCERGR
jgi:hypothetical protein